jgi:hypothetical protein
MVSPRPAPIASPPLLRRGSAEFFADAIKARRALQAVFAGPVSTIVHNMLVGFMAERARMVPYNAWVGGSRSWDAWLQQPQLQAVTSRFTEKEKVAVTSGNWDVFFACRSLDDAKALACNLQALAIAMVAELKKHPELGAAYQFSLQKRGVKPVNTSCKPDDVPSVGESFPGYGFLVNMCRSGAVKRARRGAAGAPEAAQAAPAAPAPTAIPTCASRDTTLVCYLEVFPFPHMDHAAFAKAYLYYPYAPVSPLPYLTDNGLFLFNQLIDAPRTDKGYNVDEQRLAIFFKATDHLKYPRAHIYNHAAETYERVFGQHRDERAAGLLYTQAICQAIPVAAEMLDFFDKWLMEQLRGAINAGIATLHEAVKARFPVGGASGAFVMVVGGDAMRRYKSRISITKDIDAKVYHYGLTKGALAELQNMVQTHVARLCYVLAMERARLLGATSGNTEIQLQMPPGSGVDLRIAFSNVVTAADRNDKAQFRMRRLDATASFPVDLFSIDYRATVHAAINGRPKPKINREIPVLDVVVQPLWTKKGDIPKEAAGVVAAMVRPGAVPVASETWLLKDIDTTYHNMDLAAARFWGKKRDKDAARFNALRDVVLTGRTSASSGSPVGTTRPQLPRGDLNRVDVGVVAQLKSGTGAWYIEAMKKEVAANRRRREHRHALPFNWKGLGAHPELGRAVAVPAPARQAEPAVDWMEIDGGRGRR